MPREELAMFFRRQGFKTGAEIGVLLGNYARYFVEHLEGAIHLIDSWKHYSEEMYSDGANYSQADQDINYKKVCERFSGKNVKIIRKTSAEAMFDFADESLDFVYIDANHAYPFVVQDIFGWWPKIRKGGILSGHDHSYEGVWCAICDFIEARKIPKWYISGENYFWPKPDN